MLSGEGLIAIVNPRMKRGAKGRFVKRAHAKPATHTRRRRRKSHTRKAKRSRSRAVVAFTNTRRRPRRAHRNPRFKLPSVSGIKHTLMGAGIGAIGAIGLDVGLSYLVPMLPASIQANVSSGWGRNLVRLGGALGMGLLASFVVKKETARAVAAGAATVVSADILKQLANQYLLPATHQLGSYEYAGYNPYLTGFRGLGHGGSGYASGGSMEGLRGYLPRAAAPKTMSAFMEPEHAASGMGADIEL